MSDSSQRQPVAPTSRSVSFLHGADAVTGPEQKPEAPARPPMSLAEISALMNNKYRPIY